MNPTASPPSVALWWVNNLPAILMILVFLLMTGLMYSRRISALLALPIMAVAFALVGMVRVLDFFSILNHAAGSEGAALMRWTAVGWIAWMAALLWARRKGTLSLGLAWAGAAFGLIVAGIVNTRGLAAITQAAVWSELLACLETQAILDLVVHKGALRLSEAYTVAFFGGMLAIYVKEKRLAETLIKYAAELGGDRPLVVAIVMMLATMLLFTTLGGLGAIIMVGTIIMPIMLSLGLSPYVVAGVFLIGVCAGGTFNPGGWILYTSSLPGLAIGDVQKFALFMVLLYILTGIAFTVLSTRGKWRRRRWTWAAAPALAAAEVKRVNPWALLSPVIPIILVFKLTVFAEMFLYLENRTLFKVFEVLIVGGAGVAMLLFGLWPRMAGRRGALPSPLWILVGAILVGLQGLFLLGSEEVWLGGVHGKLVVVLGAFRKFATFWDTYLGGWPFIPAFLAGLLYCFFTTWEKKGNNIQMLTKSAIEGSESVMPAVLLMCGIGMLLQVVRNEQIAGYLQPLIRAVTPKGAVLYILGFGLAAPLALYRGPLNVWGLGLGIAAVMDSTGRLEAPLLMGMFMSVGAVQGVCDPTNTHNVWIANFLGEDVLAITRFLLPYIWAMVFVGLIVAAFMFKLIG